MRSLTEDCTGIKGERMQSEKISGFYYHLLLITSIAIFNHVLVVPYILRAAYRDAWISSLLITIPGLIWGYLLYFINKRKSHRHITQWLTQQIGRPLAYSLIGLIAIYLFINVFITQKELVTWTTLTFMPQSPPILINLVFILVCLYASLSGLKSMTILNGLLLPFVILFGFLVGIGNLQHKDYSLLFPIMEYGPNRIIKGMLYPAVGMGQMIIGILLTHKVKTDISYKSIFITGCILLFLTIGPLTGVIADFGPFEAERLRFPAYEEWSLLNFGRFIEHVDFLSIYQWLAGAVIRISLFLYIIAELIQFKSQKKKIIFLISLFTILFLAVQYPISDLNYVNFTYYIFYPYTFMLITFISISLFIASLIRRQKKEEVNEHGTS